MLQINARTFNPEILYVFDVKTAGPLEGKNHHHDFVELSIIVDGGAYYSIEGQTVYLEKGSVLLFNPGISHYEYSREGMESTQIHIGFRQFTIDGFQKDFFPFDTPILKFNHFDDAFFSLCYDILAENEKKQPGYDVVLKSLVMRLVTLLLRNQDAVSGGNENKKLSEDKQAKQQIIVNAVLYLEEHLDQDITLNSLAQELYTSPTNLSRIFKEETGKTPIHYLITIRLDRAKELMKTQPHKTVKEIAQLVGYRDAYYFSKLFKKYVGLPPSEFSKKTSEEPEKKDA